MHRRDGRAWALAALLAGAALLTACPAQPGHQDGASRTASDAAANTRPIYIVTVKPLELILREVAGERASVSTLLKAGAGAHTFDPTPADIEALARADAFFWVFFNFDGWAADLASEKNTPVLPMLPKEFLIDSAKHSDWDAEAARAHEHAHEELSASSVPDPHFYTDPLLVKAILPGLVDCLGRIDPAGKESYQLNATRFGQELEALNAELQTQLAPIKGRNVIMFHPSFNYFLKRYGLVSAGVIEPFPGKEPSPKYLQAVVRQVRSAGVKAIFSETLLPAAPAEVIGEAAGVPVVELDPACGNSGRSYIDYSDWLRYNANTFLQALR